MASWYLTPLHLPGLSSSPIRHLHSHLATAADSSRAFYVWLGTDHEWQLFVHSRDSWSLQWTVNLPAAQQLNSASCLSGAGSRSLFYGRGSLIQGWTLKAKPFFTMDTQLVDGGVVKLQSWQSNALWVLSGQHTLIGYGDGGQELLYYASPYAIVDFMVMEGGVVVLACQDRCLRLLHPSTTANSTGGNNSHVLMDIPLYGIPTCITEHAGGFLCALHTGHVVCFARLDLDPTTATSTRSTVRFKRTWTLGGSTVSRRSITWMRVCHPQPWFVLTREDGALEIYRMPTTASNTTAVEGPSRNPPTLERASILAEPIVRLVDATALMARLDGTPETTQTTTTPGLESMMLTQPMPSFLALTTTGKLFLLTEKQASITKSDPSSHSLTETLNALRKEVEAMENTWQRVQKQVTSSKQVGIDRALMFPQVTWKDRFAFHNRDDCYLLTLDCDVLVEGLGIYTNFAINVPTGPYTLFTNTKNPGGGTSYWIQLTAPAHHVEIKILPIDGEYGKLDIVTCIQSNPIASFSREYTIKPLAYYERLPPNSTRSKEELIAAANEAVITGSFTVNELHAWLSLCFEELPDKPPAIQAQPNSNNGGFSYSYLFQSSFTQSQILCQLDRGKCVIRSDSLPALMIIRDVLTKEATDRKKSIDFSVSVDTSSIDLFLRELCKKWEAGTRVSNRSLLMQGLKEVYGNDSNLDSVKSAGPFFKELVEKGDAVPPSWATHRTRLESLFVQLFISYYQWLGKNAHATMIPQLRHLLTRTDSTAVAYPVLKPILFSGKLP